MAIKDDTGTIIRNHTPTRGEFAQTYLETEGIFMLAWGKSEGRSASYDRVCFFFYDIWRREHNLQLV